MNSSLRAVVIIALGAALVKSSPLALLAEGKGTIAHWSFDEAAGTSTHDSATGETNAIEGYYKYLPGVSGTGLRFDGLTTHIIRSAKDAPTLRGSFSVQAWVALNYYPWNWVPIVDQSEDKQAGYFFGVDAFGHLGLQMELDGVWQSLTSTARLPLKRWSQIVGTYDASGGLRLYLDGHEVGHLAAQGRLIMAGEASLLIGRVRKATLTFPSYFPMDPVWYSLDGILDELSIYDRSLTAEEVGKAYSAVKVPEGEVLPWPVLPSGPAGAGPFGAYYATLKYEEAWDRHRRIGPNSDVVVRFDESPMRLVFWQGTNYVPAWVTENGKWYTDQFVEAQDECPDGAGCEPISDKQSRYSRVKILESSAARVLLHWRYALNEGLNYKGAHPDPLTGWFDWVDEYWTVYPDGIAVRKQILWTTDTSKPFEFQETIIFNAPGQRPEDNINLDALIIANMKGETATYTWAAKTPGSFELSHGPDHFDKPQNPNIQLVNLKSTWKPFQIVSPENSSFGVFKVESYFTFGCWNHWPVAQIVSNVRPCLNTDRASHSSFSHIFWDAYSTTDHTITKLLLNGLTTKPAAELVPLAKSWLSAPKLDLAGQAFRTEGYDPAQRAYLVTREGIASADSLKLTIQASDESPAVNPSIVVKNWGSGKARLQINGKAVAWSKDFRGGFIDRLEGTDLVVWIRTETKTPLRISLAAEP